MCTIKFCDSLPISELGDYLIMVDGKSCKNLSCLMDILYEQIPTLPKNCTLEQCLDCLLDWSWVPSTKISLIIENYTSFLYDDPEIHDSFMSGIQDIVFTYLDHINTVVVDSSDIRDFSVFCLDGQVSRMCENTIPEILSSVRASDMKEKSTPHSLSHPVLRYSNGNLYIAFFVFFFNREQLERAKVKRPPLWIQSDIQTGEILHRNQSRDIEFSTADYESEFSIDAEFSLHHSDVYWKTAYFVFDLIRKIYIDTGEFHISLYNQYVNMLLATIPREYRRFFLELSS